MPTTRSLTYPLTLHNGGLKLSEDYAVMRESIMQILETRFAERIMRPTYGTPDFVFSSYPTVAVVIERIRIALETQLPDIQFDISGTLGEDGACHLIINWQLDQIPQPPIQYRLAV